MVARFNDICFLSLGGIRVTTEHVKRRLNRPSRGIEHRRTLQSLNKAFSRLAFLTETGKASGKRRKRAARTNERGGGLHAVTGRFPWRGMAEAARSGF